jgi:hypothetical protein
LMPVSGCFALVILLLYTDQTEEKYVMNKRLHFLGIQSCVNYKYDE